MWWTCGKFLSTMVVRDKALKGKGSFTVFPNSNFGMFWRLMDVMESQLWKLSPSVVMDVRSQRSTCDSLQQPLKASPLSVRDGKFLRTTRNKRRACAEGVAES